MASDPRSHTRVAFVMQLHEGHEEEYKERHDEIWPELKATLSAHGATNYSIFLHEATRMLFAYVEVTDMDKFAAIKDTLVCQKWWKYMDDIMEGEGTPEGGRQPKATPLREMFHMD